jgi:hypothetical protein
MALLAEHHIAGRLAIEDFDRRQRAALCAVTKDDLASLLADLPLPARTNSPHARRLVLSLPSRPSGLRRVIVWGLPPGVIGGAATVMTHHRGDLLQSEDMFVASLVTGAAGFLAHWVTSVLRRKDD